MRLLVQCSLPRAPYPSTRSVQGLCVNKFCAVMVTYNTKVHLRYLVFWHVGYFIEWFLARDASPVAFASLQPWLQTGHARPFSCHLQEDSCILK